MAQELTQADYEQFIIGLEAEKKTIRSTADTILLAQTGQRITKILSSATANRELTQSIYPCLSRLANYTRNLNSGSRPNSVVMRQTSEGLCGSIDEVINLIKRYHNQASATPVSSGENPNGTAQNTSSNDRIFSKGFESNAKASSSVSMKITDEDDDDLDALLLSTFTGSKSTATQSSKDALPQPKGDSDNINVALEKLKADLAQVISERDSWKATAQSAKLSLSEANFRAERSAGEAEAAKIRAIETQNKLQDQLAKKKQEVDNLNAKVASLSLENTINKYLVERLLEKWELQQQLLTERNEKAALNEEVQRLREELKHAGKLPVTLAIVPDALPDMPSEPLLTEETGMTMQGIADEDYDLDALLQQAFTGKKAAG